MVCSYLYFPGIKRRRIDQAGEKLFNKLVATDLIQYRRDGKIKDGVVRVVDPFQHQICIDDASGVENIIREDEIVLPNTDQLFNGELISLTVTDSQTWLNFPLG